MKNRKFLKKLESFIKENKLIQNRDKVLVGLSGGADSTALLLGLWHLKSKYNFSLLAAHVNYNLRGQESKQDEKFVKNFCFKRNIALLVKNIEIKNKSNLENKAREIRFKYFKQVIKWYNVSKLALGHNKNDQAETVLLHLFRGAGFRGLKGMTAKSDLIIRPLLDISKKQIENYLRDEKIRWRTDSTNLETVYKRNKLRNKMIPWLKDNINPRVEEKIVNSAKFFLDTEKILHKTVNRKFKNALLDSYEKSYVFSLKHLNKFLPTIRFYLYRKTYGKLTKFEKGFYNSHYEEIEKIRTSQGNKKINLPHNIVVLKEYRKMIICDAASLDKVDINNYRKINKIRRRFTFEKYRIAMNKYKKLPYKRYIFEDDNIVYLDLDKIKFPIKVRHRQPGDKFIPLGMNSHKKLKDFFIDEKIPKFDRDSILIFEDSEKIFWVGGLRIDNRVALTKKTENILKLKLEKINMHKTRAAERIKK